MRFPALASRDFQLFTAGNFFAMNGLWINRVIIGWLGWDITGLASWVGLLSFFLFAPTFVSSPLLGVLLDRVDLKRAAFVSQSMLALTLLSMLILFTLDLLSIWMLCVFAFLIGVTTSADRSIRMTIVPRMVDRAALANAVAIHGINFNTARLIGPAIGGILIEVFGTGAAMLINFFTCLPFLAALALVKPRPREGVTKARQHFLVELVDGARHAAGHPVIREAMIVIGLFSVSVRGTLEILPAIADGVFHRGAQGLGEMLAGAGAGALAGAVIIALSRSSKSASSIPPFTHLSVFVGLLAMVGLGTVGNWLVAVGLVAVIGFTATIIAIEMQSTIQLLLDDTYRGRVMSLWIVLAIGGAATGAIALGSLADLVGIPATLVGCGIAAMLGHGGLKALGRVRSTRPPHGR